MHKFKGRAKEQLRDCKGNNAFDVQWQNSEQLKVETLYHSLMHFRANIRRVKRVAALAVLVFFIVKYLTLPYDQEIS